MPENEWFVRRKRGEKTDLGEDYDLINNGVSLLDTPEFLFQRAREFFEDQKERF